jgi:hypothetical protein
MPARTTETATAIATYRRFTSYLLGLLPLVLLPARGDVFGPEPPDLHFLYRDFFAVPLQIAALDPSGGTTAYIQPVSFSKVSRS